jgi:hypothetical protein
MRGEIVLVRPFGEKPLRRRVWDVGANVVYATPIHIVLGAGLEALRRSIGRPILSARWKPTIDANAQISNSKKVFSGQNRRRFSSSKSGVKKNPGQPRLAVEPTIGPDSDLVV